eukprot:296440-Lingulodinium_polyedra.AAC.1
MELHGISVSRAICARTLCGRPRPTPSFRVTPLRLTLLHCASLGAQLRRKIVERQLAYPRALHRPL